MKEKKLQQKNNLNIFLNEHFSVIVFMVALVIFLFAYALVIAPKLNATTLLIGESIATQKKLYGEQEKRLNELKTIKKVYEEILPSDLKKFDEILPSNYIKESLFGDLEEIVVSHGFVLGEVILEVALEEAPKPGEALPGGEDGAEGEQVVISPNIGKIRAIIGINSLDYPGFKRLLKSLESSSRLFDIEDMQFSEEEGTAHFELVTYYYKDMTLK